MAERTYDPHNPLTQYLLRKQTILPVSKKGPVPKKGRPRKNKKKYLGLWGGDLEAPALKFCQSFQIVTMPLAPKNIFLFLYNPDPSIKKKVYRFRYTFLSFIISRS